MMNAELTAGGEARIIIPTVYRDTYVQALRNLSRDLYAPTMIEMLRFAQRFTASLDFLSLPHALDQLTASNAFLRASEGRLLSLDARGVVDRLRDK
jgi:hypothetical protein